MVLALPPRSFPHSTNTHTHTRTHTCTHTYTHTRTHARTHNACPPARPAPAGDKSIFMVLALPPAEREAAIEGRAARDAAAYAAAKAAGQDPDWD